jgi:hypothetical protein
MVVTYAISVRMQASTDSDGMIGVSVVELSDAFDNQTHGNESGNPKIAWHGADSLRKTARCHQQTSSRLSQTQFWAPIDREVSPNAESYDTKCKARRPTCVMPIKIFNSNTTVFEKKSFGEF